jgi:hypothetical protein
VNYKQHYDRLISRSRERVLTGYFERHHIVPRCMGGGNTNENIVKLTPEEHYVAHQLLIKIYPTNYKLAHAAVWMAMCSTGRKAYGWLRRRHAVAVSKRQTGHITTPEQRHKISESKKGKPHPRTAEWTAKIADSNRGRIASPQHRAKISAANIGNSRNLGRKFSQEHREKISASNIGKTRTRGVPKSPEHRQKIAAALLGHPLSEERKAKISAALRSYHERTA